YRMPKNLLRGGRAQLWTHGHTHDSFDYTLHGTRVICNPWGYAKAGVNENTCFDPDLMIEVGRSQENGNGQLGSVVGGRDPPDR
ncbi:MAG TPA: hypothetical protein VE421_05520, partial [Burkholderiaceae bacterium]|nr:hypothetical protein [Burkholderiaceae bacterium]